MTINCDDCGKEADYKQMPKGEHWFDWMSSSERGSDAVLIVPCDDGLISVVCYSCLEKTLSEMTETASLPIPITP